MTSKLPKLAYQAFLGVLMLTLTVTACNNKKTEKKDTTTDTTTVKPGDTLNHKPTAPGD